MTDDNHPLTAMEIWALEAVKEITDTRENVIPRVAHINELRRSFDIELTEALRSLCRRRLLKVCVDVNKNPMFSPTDRCDG